MADLTKLSVREVREGITARSFSAREVTAAYAAAAAQIKRLNAFTVLTPELAAEQAAAVDRLVASGKQVGQLAGVPLGGKDVLVTKGVPTTAGSKILAGYLPPYTATVVERVLAAGAAVVGKTNCDEFAMGSSSENSAYGPTLNPWDLARVPGGSSSGSAAAVAAGACLAALGSDTGGSIRQPAAFCGVVGLKPSYGRVSRCGLIAMASSLDSVGVLARRVEDVAFILETMAGVDERDATSSREPVPSYVAALAEGARGLKVGVPKEFFGEGLAPDVRECVQAAIQELAGLGASVREVSLPSMPYALAAYYVICPAEVSANLARFDGIRYGSREAAVTLEELYTGTRGKLLGAEVKRRIMLGTYVLSSGYYDAYYKNAQVARQAIQVDFRKVFEQVDVLATPTTPTPAFKLGEKSADPLAMYLEDVYTVPVNIAGLPAVSVPCGFAAREAHDLPVGLQLIGRWFGEADVLRLAHTYEQATPWHERRPNIAPLRNP